MRSFLQRLHIGRRHPQRPEPPTPPARQQPGSPIAPHSPHYPPFPLTQLPGVHQRSIGTQTDSEDFRPVYQRADHRKTRAARLNQAFETEIQSAADRYHGRVNVRRLVENGMVIGCVMSAPRHAAQLGEDNAEPVLLLAGNGSVSSHRPTVTGDAPFFSMRAPAGPGGVVDIGRQMRRGRLAEDGWQGHVPGGAAMPNLRIGSSHLSVARAAAFLNDAGRSKDHRYAVDVFLPAPGARVYLSTLRRLLGPDAYAGMGYAQG